MSTATMHLSQAATIHAASRNVAARPRGLALADLLNVIRSTLAMAHSIPDSGRVSARQVEQMRAVAAAI